MVIAQLFVLPQNHSTCFFVQRKGALIGAEIRMSKFRQPHIQTFKYLLLLAESFSVKMFVGVFNACQNIYRSFGLIEKIVFRTHQAIRDVLLEPLELDIALVK